MNFDGKKVIVTGAGKGIGRVVAEILVKRGAKVAALTRSADDIVSLRKDLGCQAIQVDLADAKATREAARAALPADFLINCAGTTELQSFLETTVEAFDHLIAVNTRAPMIVAQEFARSLIEDHRHGAIVNVSSVAAFVGIPDHAAYCASKGGLDGLTRVMAKELAPQGIRVNGVHPTVTLTPMAIKAWSDPEKAAGMQKRIPVGRFAEPEDVAEVILFLLSDEAAMVNGISMPVDGGYMIA
ncbi:NAD(P)-dependent dehydrogenase (short-subunit alcohol dehydrogenase family) [Rhizobium sp. BK196]|jgi:L-xylulose reductase|uniref:SDR family oxidoreductase n=1 Tax=unclassified Rhizobium TaxID=2613769 RepID=UPI00160882B0|nr:MULTISPECIES: SDR family oxidoreductase [unclassified Rhizobium]MBB3310187.1 NAD(P)-dependent dehydrogenase (short-subunit alcohol dehydrogenase family) [Rhizobium sp. BK196]MBB3462443.1 NAD(P)-dependent dehydrogenase (short-subunit alcohol dehydrogenase family) [Rhizobium sp. BK377]